VHHPSLTRRRWLIAAAAAVLAGPPLMAPRAEEPPVIAAAADLQFALEEVAELFARETGQAVRLSFGSSGNFRRQIAQGGPFEMYLSADEDYVRALHEEGFTVDEGTLYAVGRIVLIAPHGSLLEVDGDLEGLAAALAEGRITRFAIANPEHAPYGERAREALQSAGLWETIRPHLVFGENVSQAAQFALSGTAEGGIIAYSLALSPRVSARGPFALIPEEWHTPLRQRMALIKGAGETARAFYAFVQTPPAREILRRYGFALPGEEAGS
jgi:molybdate transport system substrate-binding protein